MAQRKPKPPPDEKTPFEKFQQLAKKLVAVPKEKVPKPKEGN